MYGGFKGSFQAFLMLDECHICMDYLSVWNLLYRIIVLNYILCPYFYYLCLGFACFERFW